MDEKYVIFSNGEDCILVKVFGDCNTSDIVNAFNEEYNEEESDIMEVIENIMDGLFYEYEIVENCPVVQY